MNDTQRVDPPTCGCTDCLTGYSVPLNLATWQTIRAMIHGDVQDATSTDLDVMVVVTPARERGWPDRQAWKWKYGRTPPTLAPHHVTCRCNECYATLQAEHLAAADLDPRWPG